ncbi:pre-toxin TG domain-containing protein, partial [Schinkia azotoformans]|uniref:pre-toxin TG domain-containing protein n=1 Tax=Schinkia azotoformans TaxID=1454 RepID=UPI002E1F5561|nr:pre-toxin TG domain-containing protein [Schinkia azotoformans]
MAKSSRFTKSKNAARSVLGSIPIKGVIKKGAKALKKASKAAKKKVSTTKKKVVASLKTQKKTVKKKIGKIVRKRGKVFTKARKLKNNLTKKERIQNLKKNMNKAVLAAKSIPKKTANYVKDHVKEIASFAVDSTPYVGTAKAFQQATTGVDLITGQKLSTGDRIAEGV